MEAESSTKWINIFKSHDKCTSEKCFFRSVEADGTTYKTQHHPSCHDKDSPEPKTCTQIGPDLLLLKQEIRRGNIPLLEYKIDNMTGQKVVNVVEHTPYKSYATISHVWADGYGNPAANELWTCQLDFFKTLIEKGNLKDPQQQNPLFWIDTLAIPVHDDSKEERRMAIRKIHEIYTNAKFTIVIDNGLNQMSSGSTYQETAMRILASGWMRRLWTLQEAYLSRRLLFAFADEELRNLDDLEELYPQANNVLTSNIPTAARNYFHNLLGPDRRARINEVAPATGFGLLASVWRAAQWRVSRHASLEAQSLFRNVT